MTVRSRLAGALAVLVIAGAPALLAWPAPAWAHNFLVSAAPAEDAELSTAPKEIELTYDQPVGRQFSQVAVTGPDGESWHQGEPSVSGNSVVQPLRPLGPAGTYTVSWRVVSADGHPISGSYAFTLNVGDSAGDKGDPGSAGEQDSGDQRGSEQNPGHRQEGEQDARATPDGGSQGPPWAWIGLGLVGALAVAGVVLGGVRRGHRRHTPA